MGQAVHVPSLVPPRLGDLRAAASRRPRRTLAVLAGTLAATVAAVLLAVGVLRDGPAGEPAPRAVPSPSTTPSTSPPEVDTTEDATYAQVRPGHPERLVVPDLGVDAPVVPIEAPGRTLTPPADPQVLGWWVDGARPGASAGSALVVGHTVHSGGGALDDLDTLEEGSRVLVRSTRADRDVTQTTSYVVQSVRVYRKGRLAQRAADLFSQEVDGRLVLLTCEDWTGTRYLSNVVVTAVPDGAAGA